MSESSGGSNSAEAAAIGRIVFKFGKGSVERFNTGGLEDFGKVVGHSHQEGNCPCDHELP